ncbi:transmembrane protein 184C-like [Mya arenaria]|uniref:transmembrane protein 184C-like n=1 Tax=Mya arenaria TaxID=6604 RepID=UPI0022E1C19D|nr:transmembrane protein 184C-like [Mya arenaria]
MDFIAHWKNWIRPLTMMVYFILMMIAIPLCIIELTSNKDKHVKAWFTGGVFVLIAVPLSLWEIILHTINYTQPHLQKYIIRIIWMVPIYALNAWFALRFKEAAIYLDTIRECYEAYVIYNFMAYLLSYLWSVHPQLEIAMRRSRPQKHLIPFCCLPPWPMGSKMLQRCKHGVLQYTVVRPITTIIALICEVNGVYHEGKFSGKAGWTYLVIINNISQIWAMYCLVLFYRATRQMLAPIKPIPKFLCVKFVVFFSFWQSVLIAGFVKLKVIPSETEFYPDGEDAIGKAIQDFLICIEMFIAAVMHYFAFSHKPFINEAAPQGNCCQSFMSMWNIQDVRDDVVEHVKVVTTTMKKTVSGPFRTLLQNESTPLLASGETSSSGAMQNVNEFTASLQSMPMQGDTYQMQADTQSTDWDVTSIDRWQEQRSKDTKSVTSSMHNYLDSSSMENQPVQSQTIEHLADSDEHYKSKQLTDVDENGEHVQGSENKRTASENERVMVISETVIKGSKENDIQENCDTDSTSEKPLIDFENGENQSETDE